jgi:hypothetical protein
MLYNLSGLATMASGINKQEKFEEYTLYITDCLQYVFTIVHNALENLILAALILQSILWNFHYHMVKHHVSYTEHLYRTRITPRIQW